MPIYQVSLYQGEKIYIVRADSEDDIETVLEIAEFEVDGKTVFATRERYRTRGIDKVVKIGD